MRSPESYPTGIVTVVFTDLENHSPLWREYGSAFLAVLEEHNGLLRQVLARCQGLEAKHTGDGFLIAFARASDALQFALEAQRAFNAQEWMAAPERGGAPKLIKLRIRIGVHTGEANAVHHPDGALDYFGAAVNIAARIEAAAHGGQILISEATRLLAATGLPETIQLEDLGVHRLKGVGEERLWQVCHPDLHRHFPPPNTLDPESHNLPLPSTPFIGREKELAAWSGLLLEPRIRLVTIVGFGGMGKTRLALQLAELCYNDFGNGVWWVPLETVTTGDEMVQRIAEELRLPLQPEPTIREQVWRFLRNRKLLLVLDNMEQIQGTEGGEVVLELLKTGRDLKCLVTSRRGLNLSAEQLVELAPLPGSDAERLFVERAGRKKESFVLTEGNAADIAAICRKLEGLPLAIEIAASLVRGMTPRQMLQWLDDRLKRLVSQDPGLPARQRALRAAIDWSYNLLSLDAREVFAQLPVFAGGFTLEAAEVVCQCSNGLESLLELRDHSLLRAETTVETQQERLWMLEALRAYAREKSTDVGVEHRHAKYFLGFAEERAKSLRTRREVDVLCELEVEFDNLRAAMDWAESRSAELCARLALVFHQPLHLRGLWDEALQCLERGWKAAQELGSEGQSLHAALRRHLANLAHDRGDNAAAKVHAEASLATYRELKDSAGMAGSLNLLGLLTGERDKGKLPRAKGETTRLQGKMAQEIFQEALGLWPSDNHAGRAITLHNLARLAAARGDPKEAFRLYEESLLHRRQAGDARGEATTLGNLGTLAQEAGDLASAAKLYHQSLALLRTLRQPFQTAVMLNNLGDLAVLQADLPRALALFVHAERIFRNLQSRYASEPARSLDGLREQMGTEPYAELRREAEEKDWEELLS